MRNFSTMKPVYYGNSKLVKAVYDLVGSSKAPAMEEVKRIGLAVSKRIGKLSEGERDYIVREFDRLHSKFGESAVAADMRAISNQVSAYRPAEKRSFAERISGAVESVRETIRVPRLTYALVPAAVGVLAAATLIGGTSGCKPKQEDANTDTNRTYEISVPAPTATLVNAPKPGLDEDPQFKKSTEAIKGGERMIGELKELVDRQNSNYERVSSDYKQVRDENASLRDENSRIRVDSTMAHTREGVLRAELNGMKKDYTTLKADYERQQKGISALSSKLGQLEQKVGQVLLANDNLARSNRTLQATINDLKSTQQKDIAKPVVNVARPIVDYDKLNKEGEIAAIAREKNYNAEMKRFAKEEAIVRSSVELDKERQTKVKIGEVRTSSSFNIVGGQIKYNNASVINTATNVVKAIPLVPSTPQVDSTNKYRIDVKASPFSEKNKKTRWERKAEDRKFNKMPENDGIHGTGNFEEDYGYFVRNYSTSPEMGGINPKGNVKKAGGHLRGAVNNLAEIVTLQTFSPESSKARLGYPAAVDDFVDAGEKLVSGFNIHKEWNKVYKGTNPVTGTGRFLGRLVGNTFNFFGRGLTGLITGNASKRVIDPAISAGRNIVDGVVRQPLKAGANSVRGIDYEEADDAADAMNAMIDFGLDSLTMVGIDDAMNPEKSMKNAGELSKYRTLGSLLAVGAEIGTGTASEGGNGGNGGVINTLSGGRVGGVGIRGGSRVGGVGIR